MGEDTGDLVGPSLGLLLAHAEHTVRLRLGPVLAEAGLSVEHWRIMAVLLARPGLPMASVATAAVVPSATLTRHVDRLVDRALVVRRIDPADKRRVVVALSPMGTELAGRLRAAERSVEDEISTGLGRSRYAALVRELSLLPHLSD